MGKYFGTDGFRGEANVDLNVIHAVKIGRFLSYYFGGGDSPARIVIGKDTRLSGYMFEYGLVAGLMAGGAETYLLHVATTPCVAYVTKKNHFDCGIVISASHNPYYDNGIKIINSQGQKISSALEDRIEEYIDDTQDPLPFATRDKIGKTIDLTGDRDDYLKFLRTVPTCDYSGLRIAVDCSNGAASAIVPKVFEGLGAEVSFLFNKPDGTNINRGCGSTHTQALQDYVAGNHLDAGFAYDGDADRCFAVDQNGRLINGDQILYLCGRYLQEKGRLKGNAVAATKISNIGLRLSLEQLGIDLAETDVGDKYVAKCMRNHGYVLGGEQTGHIIFGEYEDTGDGILTSLMLLNVLAEKRKPFAELLEPLRIYPQLSKNVPVSDKKMAREDPDLNRTKEIIEKELKGTGRVIIRESGTEPVLRLMVEAPSDNLCGEMMNRLTEVLYAKGYIDQ